VPVRGPFDPIHATGYQRLPHPVRRHLRDSSHAQSRRVETAQPAGGTVSLCFRQLRGFVCWMSCARVPHSPGIWRPAIPGARTRAFRMRAIRAQTLAGVTRARRRLAPATHGRAFAFFRHREQLLTAPRVLPSVRWHGRELWFQVVAYPRNSRWVDAPQCRLALCGHCGPPRSVDSMHRGRDRARSR
jgi:hypothetical protein